MRPLILLLAGTIASVAAGSNAAVVLTESFELPDTANFTTFNNGSSIVTATNTWLVTASGVDLFEDAARAEAVAFDGAQALDLAGSPGAGVISTTFATTPGQSYALEFHYARNNLIGVTTADARVEVIGTATLLSVQISHGSPTVFSLHTTFEQTFVADATQCTLRFTSLEVGNAGVTIDAISIESVEPVDVFPYSGSRAPGSASGVGRGSVR